jgi:hypothetical protein
VQVAVLSGEELDPLSAMVTNGIETHTLWGELGAQLGRYDLVAEHDRARMAPGGAILQAVLGQGPALVLVDEFLPYVEKGHAVPQGESTLGRQAMLFIQALTEVANNRPQTAMVYSLQASAGEAAGAEGLLSQLEHLVSRVDAKREPVTGDEVMRVVQRRLFAELGEESEHRRAASAYAELVHRQLVAEAETEAARREAEVEARRLEERVLLAYPFHPGLLDLMHHRWGSLPSYQRTRGALQFLACVVHDLWERGDDAALIGPGEVNLADGQVRGAFFTQVGERERYASVLDADIVSDGSGAAVVDRRVGTDSPALAQLRMGTRAATAIMLYSFGSREGEERGVLERDLVAAALVPGVDRNVIVAALHDLREEEIYLHYAGRRYRFEPVPNLTKLIRDEAQKFSGDEVLAIVREELERQLVGARGAVVWPEAPAAVRDRLALFQVAYLHPDWSDPATPLRTFVEEARGGRRAYRNGIAFALPDTGQFDRARAAARIRLALDSLLDRKAAHGFTAEQETELRDRLAGARRELSGSAQHAYSRAALPVRRNGEGGTDAYEIEEADLRSLLSAGRSLHDRVLEALSNRVFSSITVDRLIGLSRLGAERPFVRCTDLVDWFYSFFEFVKLSSGSVIASAIADGVLDRKLAYCAAAEVLDDALRVPNPALLRREGMLAASEVDLGGEAVILTPELAATFTPEPTASLTPLGMPAPPISSPAASTEGARAETGAASRPVGLSRLRVHFKITHEGFFALSRALSWLREQSTTVSAEVTLDAGAKADGYDPVRLRNGFYEQLEEGGAEFLDDQHD